MLVWSLVQQSYAWGTTLRHPLVAGKAKPPRSFVSILHACQPFPHSSVMLRTREANYLDHLETQNNFFFFFSVSHCIQLVWLVCA